MYVASVRDCRTKLLFQQRQKILWNPPQNSLQKKLCCQISSKAIFDCPHSSCLTSEYPLSILVRIQISIDFFHEIPQLSSCYVLLSTIAILLEQMHWKSWNKIKTMITFHFRPCKMLSWPKYTKIILTLFCLWIYGLVWFGGRLP